VDFRVDDVMLVAPSEPAVTVSAAALYLMRTLERPHELGADERLFPCCGNTFFEIPDGDVVMPNCCDGVDFAVSIESRVARICAIGGARHEVREEDWRAAVFAFADDVAAFYATSWPKEPFDDDDALGFASFGREWERRRGRRLVAIDASPGRGDLRRGRTRRGVSGRVPEPVDGGERGCVRHAAFGRTATRSTVRSSSRLPLDHREDALHEALGLQVEPCCSRSAPVHACQRSLLRQLRDQRLSKLVPRNLVRLEARLGRNRCNDALYPRSRRPEWHRTLPRGRHRSRVSNLVAHRPHDPLRGDLPIERPRLRAGL
jgi:hypothetical protein